MDEDNRPGEAPAKISKPEPGFVQLGAEAPASEVTASQGRLLDRLQADRPQAFPSLQAWFLFGIGRVPTTAAASLLCTALNLGVALWLMLFLGVFGFVFGGFIGPLVASSMVGAYGSLTGGVGGVVTGAGLGVYLATFRPLHDAAHGDPGGMALLFLIEVLIVLVLAAIWTLAGILLEPLTMRLRGYRRMSKREADLILPLVGYCMSKLGLRGRPVVLINDSADTNAFAWKRHIVINRGVYDALRRPGAFQDEELFQEELGGLIAHELWHWRQGDAIGRSFVFALALPTTIAHMIGTYLYRLPHWLPQTFGIFYLVYAYPIMRWVLLPLYGYDSRRVEYECDQAAVRAGFQQGLYRLLSKLQDFEGGEGATWSQVLSRTHPPVELRLERLDPRAVVRPPTTAVVPSRA